MGNARGGVNRRPYRLAVLKGQDMMLQGVLCE